MWWLFPAFLVAVAPASIFAQCSQADRAALEALDRAWGEASRRGDRAYLQSVFAEDYARVTLTGTVNNATAIVNKATAIDNDLRQAEINRARPEGPPKISSDSYVITCTPNTATVTHRFLFTTGQPGSERTTYSRSIHFFEKRGGRWQVVSDAGHSLGDAGLLVFACQARLGT